MDTVGIGITAFRYLISILPQPKPPGTDYNELRSIYNEHYEKLGSLYGSPGPAADVQPAMLGPAPLPSPAPAPKVTTYRRADVSQVPEKTTASGAPVSTSCIACSQSHITGIAGFLEESLRFAREGGVTHPEALRRIDAADREIVNMERLDLSPESILNSPKQDQELARYFMPKIRVVRQAIGQITDVSTLEKAAAEASILSQEFRLKRMEAAGTDLNPIVALAKRVQSGELTIEEAREAVKQYLPKEK